MNKSIIIVILLITNVITAGLFFIHKNESRESKKLAKQLEKKIVALALEAEKQKDLALRNEQLALVNEKKAFEQQLMAEEERRKCAARKR
jgi:hypothetical protein